MERLERRDLLSAVTPVETEFPASSFREEWATALLEAQLNSRDVLSDAGGNDFGTAYRLGTLDRPVSLSGWVGAWDPRDVVQFELTDPAEIRVDLAGLSSDIDLYLFDSETRLVGRSLRGGSQEESISGELAAGSYYLLVAPYRHAASTYRLTLSAEKLHESKPDTAGNRFSDARDLGTLQDDLSLSEYVGQDDWADFYQFETNAPLDIDVSPQTANGAAGLYVFNAQRQLLDVRFTQGRTDDTAVSLDPGSYFVVVAVGGSTETGYDLRFDRNDPLPAENRPIPSTPFPDVAYFGGEYEWNLNAIGAPEVWAQGYTGEGVVVAVLDTGIDLDHRDLRNNVWVNADETLGDGIDNDANGFVDDVYGWDFAHGDNLPDDHNGHGTHVAGTIAAANNGYGATGVAFDAAVMAVQVLGAEGSGSVFDVAAGIYYAVDNGADIINLSLGGGGFSSTIYTALQYAQAHSVLVVAAAGNEGKLSPVYPAVHGAQLDNVLSVGAFTQSNQIAGFSNQVGSSGAVQVDAPGARIYSTYLGGRFAVLSGTSMAAPHVAGMAALALAANPSLTAAELRQALVDGATRSITRSDSAGGLDGAAAVPVALAAHHDLVAPASQGRMTANSSVTTAISASEAFRPGLLSYPRLENALALHFDVVDAIFAESALDPWRGIVRFS